MSDLFSKIKASFSLQCAVTNYPDNSRQLDNQQINVSTFFRTIATNPVDPTRPLDKQELKIYTYVDLKPCQNEYKKTQWNIDELNLEKVICAEHFVAQSKNPLPDATRPLDKQSLKVIDFAYINITHNYVNGTWTTNPDNARDSKQPLKIYDWNLVRVDNQAPDPKIDLKDQKIKVYPWTQLVVDNPPWVRGNLKIPNHIKVIWEQHPVRFKMEIGSRLQAFHHLRLNAKVNITETYGALNLQFADVEQKLNITPTLVAKWEQHKVRESVGISDSWFAVMTTKHKGRLRLKHSFAATNTQYAKIKQKVLCRGRVSAGEIWEDMPHHIVTIKPTLKVASITTKLRKELVWIKGHFGQHEENPWRTRGIFTTSFSAQAINPENLSVTYRGKWRDSYEAKVIAPPSKINFALTITPTQSATATNPSQPVEPGEPDTPVLPDTGEDFALEEVQSLVWAKSWCKDTQIVKYREVLAVASLIDHTPNAVAIIHGKLKINFEINNVRGGAEKLESALKITDNLKISTQEQNNVLEYVKISSYFRTEGGVGDDEHTTYVINEDNETTRYEHWPFTGYATFKGVSFGCGPDGIYELVGDNDDGKPIAAMINFGKQSFGSQKMKRVPYVYASLASDGDMSMQVSYTDDNVYMYPARKVDEYNATVRFDLGRGIKANYLNFELYNENGADFDLRNLGIYLVELSRRI